MASETSIKVRQAGSGGDYSSVAWPAGSSLESINQSISSAAGIESPSTIIARDQDGNVVCISDSLPRNIKLEINALDRNLQSQDTGNAVSGLGQAIGKIFGFQSSKNREQRRQAQFRGTVLKLENVQAHLANERTWLAWARTALSALTVAFSLLTLADDTSAGWLAVSLFVTGCFMVLNVMFTFVTGWLRYVRIKDVLLMTKSDLTDNFNRFGISHHARFLILLLAVISGFYMAGSSDLS
mmetsp:Transcript_40587/g.52272  ORF Transcript_40587/g.52272 Transcript_40587/m.52272 type:complete len:240 (+) Transcript_40587:63-782(+)